MNIFQSVTIVLVVIAAGWDLATRRIPNVLTFGAALAGFFVHGYIAGWSGAESSLAGWAVGVLFFFPMFALGGMGAGDVKLLAAVGAWLGPSAGLDRRARHEHRRRRHGPRAVALSGYLKQACTNLRCF